MGRVRTATLCKFTASRVYERHTTQVGRCKRKSRGGAPEEVPYDIVQAIVLIALGVEVQRKVAVEVEVGLEDEL